MPDYYADTLYRHGFLIPRGLPSPAASALDAIRAAATRAGPVRVARGSAPAMPPISSPAASQAISGQTTGEDGVRLYSIHEGDAWVRTGAPDFTPIKRNGRHVIIPRFTRVHVTDEQGSRSYVESVDGRYSEWTASMNLTWYFRENHPPRDAALAPDSPLSTDGLSGAQLATARLYNRAGGLFEACARAECEDQLGAAEEERVQHVVAWALSVFQKEVGCAEHSEDNAIIRIEPHRIRDIMLEGADLSDARAEFKRHFFKNDSGSWRFSEDGDGNSLPLYPDASGGTTGSTFQNRQQKAVQVARTVLENHDLDPDGVLEGVSIGGPQILAADIEYDLHCGYGSAGEMWEAFQGPDERAHVLGYFDYIRNKKHPRDDPATGKRERIHTYMLDGDFRKFGHGYNGSETEYGDKLEEIYDQVVRLFEE